MLDCGADYAAEGMFGGVKAPVCQHWDAWSVPHTGLQPDPAPMPGVQLSPPSPAQHSGGMASPTLAPQRCAPGVQPDLVPHRQYTPRGHRLTPHRLVPHPDLRCPGLARISALPAGGRGSGPARLGFCIWNAFCGTTLNFFDILSAFLPLKKSGKENSAEKGFKGEKGCKACGRSRRQEYQNIAMLRAACFAEGKDEFRLPTAQYKTFMQLCF